jgi:hypothetical protein
VIIKKRFMVFSPVTAEQRRTGGRRSVCSSMQDLRAALAAAQRQGAMTAEAMRGAMAAAAVTATTPARVGCPH